MAQSHAITRTHRHTHAETHDDRILRISRALLKDIFGPPSARHFDIRFWNGTTDHSTASPTPNFTIAFTSPQSLRRMFLPPGELNIAESYLRDDYNIEGDMESATALAQSVADRLHSPLTLARIMARLLALPTPESGCAVLGGPRSAAQLTGKPHSEARDAAAVRYHYDVGNDFYSLWLDRRMVYSCAYFPTGRESIDEAQEAKLDYICRKLRLQPGERLLDIGCGWGGLILYAAQHYGVDATGITLSEPQAELARQRITESGLQDRCRVEVRDYREIPASDTFDKIVSVGMFEHVGRAQLPTYFKQAYRLLKPGGIFLNHGIVNVSPERHTPADLARRKLWHEGEFNNKYVFPDGELITPGEVLDHAENAGFETRDLESLREHYAMTLRHWVSRLEAHHDEAVKLVGEVTYRVWRLYMAAAAHGFATGHVGIVQAVLVKQAKNGLSNMPPTRAELYSAEFKR
jgi:cyclopropane-fatty-acyl-phospholipid synthase